MKTYLKYNKEKEYIKECTMKSLKSEYLKDSEWKSIVDEIVIRLVEYYPNSDAWSCVTIDEDGEMISSDCNMIESKWLNELFEPFDKKKKDKKKEIEIPKIVKEKPKTFIKSIFDSSFSTLVVPESFI